MAFILHLKNIHHGKLELFFYISRAFDKVWHKGLIFKLRCYGIKGPLLNSIKSYLSKRKHMEGVVLKGKSSKGFILWQGYPKVPSWDHCSF